MATAPRDYYEVLGVNRDADQKTIRDAFRTLALRYHPDRNKEVGAEEKFKEIAQAYAVLSDPKKRADYHTGGFAGVAGFSPEDLFSGIDFDDIFGGLGFDFGGEGLFERFFRRRQRRGPAPGANLQVELVVPLERVVTGGEETVRISRPAACATCRGSGAKPGTNSKLGDACKGSGRQVRRRREAGMVFQQTTTCMPCRGQGKIIEHPCAECRGSGEVEREEALTVKIPIGVEEGMVLRVPGHGLPSAHTGGLPGDLYVLVRTAPDQRSERSGADLWRTETLQIADAVLGTSLEVPTLNGGATVTVPAGTQADAVLRLRGKGLPEFGGRGRGDLYLRIAVEMPKRISKAERELYERLRTLGRGGRR